MPDNVVIRALYRKYMQREEMSEPEQVMLMRFLHEIVGCVNLQWKEKSLKNGTYLKIGTTSDKAFALFMMRDYAKIPKKEDEKKKKLVGARLESAMDFFNQMMRELKELKTDKIARIDELDLDICNYIRKQVAARKKGKKDGDDESTLTSVKVDKELKYLQDFDALFGSTPKTAV
jgi:hypothetical protein